VSLQHSSDTIRLVGVAATGRHGVHEHERRDGQRFVVDVALRVDASRAAASDDLADTVDYSTLASQIVALIEGEPVNLIETLAGAIADRCLEHGGVFGAEVTVHKPEAPLQLEFADVAVTIDRSRP
jgi:dihydroneopterin aldolase